MIPIAVIAASIAMLAKVISSGYELNKKLTAVRDLTAQGYKPTQVTELIKNMGHESFLEPIRKIVPMLALLTIGIVIVSKIDRR